jgi:DNA-binding transcriptional LysR family regulator
MSDTDLRDLDAFVAVARTRNFRRAARRGFQSQPVAAR